MPSEKARIFTMTGKQWRKTVEYFVNDLESALSIGFNAQPKDEPQIDRILREKAEEQTRIIIAKAKIEAFKTVYLNRETADDFDEV